VIGSGVLIAFEGIDGSGKSTQVARFDEWARARGVDPLHIREPGGTQLGERVRDLLLDPATGDIAPAAEALLYAASRAELVSTTIAPALREGRLVIADRFVDSSLAYQGAGRELGIDDVLAANQLALAGLMPTRTILVRVDAETAAQRLASHGEGDRIERAGLEFFKRVVDAYDQLAAAQPERFIVVDGSFVPNQVHDTILEKLEPVVASLLTVEAR
jgi:dTMP kinase